MSEYIAELSRSSQKEIFSSRGSVEKDILLDFSQLDKEKEEVDRQILQHLELNKQLKEDIEAIKIDIKKLDETCEAYDLKKDDEEISDLKREIEELKVKDHFLSQELIRKEEALKSKTEEGGLLHSNTIKLLESIEIKKVQLQELEEEVNGHNYQLEKDLEIARVKENELKNLTKLLEAQEAILKNHEQELEQEVARVKAKEEEKSRLLDEKEARLKELASIIALESKERERYHEINRSLALKEEEIQIKKQNMFDTKPELEEDLLSKSTVIENLTSKLKVSHFGNLTPQRSTISMFETPISRNHRSSLSFRQESSYSKEFESKKHDLLHRIKNAQYVKKELEEKQNQFIVKSSILLEDAKYIQYKAILVCLIGFLFGVTLYRIFMIGY